MDKQRTETNLNRAQIICKASYCAGEFDSHEIASTEDAQEIGDGLFSFLMRELADSEDCSGLDEACNRMRRIVAEVQDVYSALTEAE